MMERDGGAALEFHSHFQPSELERLLRLGFEIEDRSWKGEEGSSVLKQPGLFDFTLRQARHYAERGELRLVFLKLAGEPIAFTFQCRSKGTQFCEKLGYDQEFRKYGPGRQMIMRLLQELHADPGCDVLDFAGRFMAWNAEWATRTSPVGRIIAAPAGIAGRTLFEAYRYARHISQKPPHNSK
jgi:CelD/BcsL family acetyltransferase involved in cellulose biosynthesis